MHDVTLLNAVSILVEGVSRRHERHCCICIVNTVATGWQWQVCCHKSVNAATSGNGRGCWRNSVFAQARNNNAYNICTPVLWLIKCSVQADSSNWWNIYQTHVCSQTTRPTCSHRLENARVMIIGNFNPWHIYNHETSYIFASAAKFLTPYIYSSLQLNHVVDCLAIMRVLGEQVEHRYLSTAQTWRSKGFCLNCNILLNRFYCLRRACSSKHVTVYPPAVGSLPQLRLTRQRIRMNRRVRPGKKLFGSQTLAAISCSCHQADRTCQVPVGLFFSTTLTRELLISLAAALHAATTQVLGQCANAHL